jgi:ATP adenylyltransferase
MNQHCTFCEKLGRKSVRPQSLVWDRVLFESPNFAVVPTIGAIIEGWLLIVPRKHHICFGALRGDLLPELKALQNQTRRALEECYGPVAIFEHGPTDSKQPIGCSVDHAHLHILATGLDLLAEVKHVFSQGLTWTNIDSIGELRTVYDQGLPYLYLEQPIGTGYFASHPNFESQIFRKVIAKSVGTPHRFDWRSFPESQTVESTVATIERWIVENRRSGTLGCVAVAA